MPVLNGSKVEENLIILHQNYNMAKSEYVQVLLVLCVGLFV